MQRAVLIMFLAMSMIPAGDSAGKLLSSMHGTAPLFVAWSRFLVGALLLLPFIPSSAWALLRNWRIWVRATILAMGISFIQIALQTEEVATVFAAFFVGPLISYVLAVIFLREPVTPLRSVLIMLGFIGVLIVVRPGMGASTGVLWAVAAGACYGVFLTMSRWLGPLASPLAMTFIQLFIAALILLPLGLSNLPTFTGTVAGLTLISALCSMMGNLLLLYAYQLVPATRIAPLVYFQLVAAVGLGWLIFGALPDMWTWTGLIVIITAGLASARLR
jgi:drug/metabolite transporter (DMT)-like permease